MVFKPGVSIILVCVLAWGGWAAGCKENPGDALPPCSGDFRAAAACEQHKTAVALVAAGQYQAAERGVLEIIAANPQFYGAYRTLGEILPRYNTTETTAEFLDKLQERKPADCYVFWALGLLKTVQEDFPAAAEYFKQTIKRIPEFYDAYENLVDACRMQGKLQEAGAALEAWFCDLQEEGCQAAVYGLAYLCYRLGKIKEASDLCVQLCSRTHPRDAGRLYKLAGILYSMQKMGSKAYACYECALKAFRACGDIQGEMAALINLGIACDLLLDYEKALELYRQALPLAVLLQNPVYEGLLLMDAAIACQNLNDYSQSFLYYQQALAHFTKSASPNSDMLVSINNNLGSMHEALSAYSRARSYYSTALLLSREAKRTDWEIDVLNNLGEVYKDQGEYDSSLDYYRRALELSEADGDSWTKAVVLNNIGEIFVKTGKYREALDAFKQSLEYRKQTDDRRGEGITMKNTGYLFYLEGDYAQALVYYRKALQLAGKESAEITGEMGICCLALKQYNEALKWLEKSIAVTEMFRSRLVYGKHKTGFMRSKKRIYDAMVELLYTIHEKQPGDSRRQEHYTAFEYGEKAKARTLFNLLEENRVEIKKGIAPELAARQTEIGRIYSAKNTQLQEELQKSVKDENKTLVSSLVKDLKQLENDYEDVLTRATLENPGYGQMIYSRPVTVAQIRECLPDASTLLLSYQVTEKALFVWLIGKEEYIFSRLAVEQKTLQEKILYLYHLLAKPAVDDEYLASASELYTLLIKPVLPAGSRYDKLIIIPDGILHYLPFETLAAADREEQDTPAYLVREYSIQYVQSAAILYYLYNQGSREQENDRPHSAGAGETVLLAVGDPVLNTGTQPAVLRDSRAETLFRLQDLKPLPFSSREVQEIGALFPRKSVLNREAALEEWIKQPGSLDGYAYIHFATHSIINEESPYNSGLVLTQDTDPREDGFLQVREIFNLETGADLVVLSACSTTLGEYTDGEGITGLTSAWMYAGAAAVIASLWNVQDESTAAFMSAFYKHITAGFSPAAALRAARLELMMQDKYRHPCFWAGFVLTGRSYTANQVVFPIPNCK